MSAEDLEKYETEMELKLYREYRDVVGLFKYVIETERRFYLTNDYEMQVHSVQGEVFFEVSMADAWVWDMYRPARFVKQVTGTHVQGREHRGAQQERPGAARAAERIPAPRPARRPSRPGRHRFHPCGCTGLTTVPRPSTKIQQLAEPPSSLAPEVVPT
ncbi:hypothetical protein SALBM217S_08458 [Streptomyces griseoloalbus]